MMEYSLLMVDILLFKTMLNHYNLGSDVLAMSEEDPSLRKDPLNSVFPKVAKCTFNKFGPSGTIEKFDGLCILSLNIINEKVNIIDNPS